ASRTWPVPGTGPLPRAPPAGRSARARPPRSRAPAAPARPSGPGGRGSPPSAVSVRGPSTGGCAGALEPRGERLARDALVGLLIAAPRPADNVVGQRRRGGRLVPPRTAGPVTHV